MAIVSTNIDGQNIGFKVTAPDTTVDVFTIDFATNEFTSAYLSAEQLRNLKLGYDSLAAFLGVDVFTAFPTFIDRLVTIASINGVTLTTSLGGAPPLGIVQVAVGSDPGYFNVHLPFTPESTIAWASGGASGGLATPVSLANGGTGDDLSAATDGVVTLDAGLGKMVVTSQLAPDLNSRGVTGLDSVARSGSVTIDPANNSTWFVDTTIASSTIDTSFSTWWTKSVSMTMAVYVAGDAVNTLTFNVEAGATVQWLGGAAPAWYPGPSALGAGVNGVLFLTNIKNGASKIIIASWQVAA